MAVDFIGRADLFDPAPIHDCDLIGDFEGLVLVVSHEDAGNADLVVKLAQPAPQLQTNFRIERAERLVQQQYAWFDCKRARQGDSLPLAAGELRRIAACLIAQLNQLEQLPDAFANPLRRRTLLADVRASRRRCFRTPSCVEKVRSVERRIRRGARALRSPMSSPSNCTTPESAISNPAIIRKSVVLPEPDGPSSATSRPRGISRSTVVERGKSSEHLRDLARDYAHAISFLRFPTLHSTRLLTTSVTNANNAKSEATANAGTN